MPFDDFDKMIRDAADNHHPPYNQGGWHKMKRLLDKHLPEKKGSRRFIAFLLFFLFLSGGLYFTLQYVPGAKKNMVNNNEDPVTGNPDEGTNTVTTGKTEPEDNIPSNNTITPAESESKNTLTTSANEEADKRNPVSGISENNQAAQPGKKAERGLKGNNNELENKNVQSAEKRKAIPSAPVQNERKIRNDYVQKKPVSNAPEQKEEFLADKNVAAEKKENITSLITDPEIKKTEIEPAPVNETDQKEKETEKSNPVKNIENNSADSTQTRVVNRQEIKQKSGNNPLKNLFFTVSAGPDISTVGLEPGQIQPAYGIGIGYTISDKLAVRTGFYTARKIYTANGSDYKASQIFLNYYPNLKSVDADCRVYEIPLLIDYNFSQRKKHSWFASAGLSTFLMKKETYGYHYKPNWSPDYIYKEWTINNENKHLFSVLNISGGYTSQINRSFSLRAEPYMKISLSGIGHGKINLNSGGILFTAIIKPFEQNK